VLLVELNLNAMNERMQLNSCLWSPDGTKVMSGSNDGTVHVWNVVSDIVIAWSLDTFSQPSLAGVNHSVPPYRSPRTRCRSFPHPFWIPSGSNRSVAASSHIHDP
jgi:WD40 repeat protein